MANRVIVSNVGGSLTLVEAPPDVRVIFRDYDIENYSEDQLTKDKSGNEVMERVVQGGKAAPARRRPRKVGRVARAMGKAHRGSRSPRLSR